MTWTVTVLFDHKLVDETHYFEDRDEALKCQGALEAKYRGQRLYRVKMEEIEIGQEMPEWLKGRGS